MFRNTIDTTQLLQRMDELKDVTAGTAQALQRGANSIIEAVDRRVTTPLVFGSKLVQGENETNVEIYLNTPKRNRFIEDLQAKARWKRQRRFVTRQRTWRDYAKLALVGIDDAVRFEVEGEIQERLP